MARSRSPSGVTPLGSFQQPGHVILAQEVRQLLVLPRSAQAIGRVRGQRSLPAQEAKPRAHRRDAAGDGRFRIALLVQPGQVRANHSGGDPAWLLPPSPSWPRKYSTACVRSSRYDFTVWAEAVLLEAQVAQVFGERFIHRRQHPQVFQSGGLAPQVRTDSRSESATLRSASASRWARPGAAGPARAPCPSAPPHQTR